MSRNNLIQKKHLIAVGLNPAWQKTLLFPEFIPGEVNRADSVSLFPAGKGINFARASKIWGFEPEVFHFLGRETGKLIAEGLESEKIPHNAVWLRSPTRTCTTCLSSKDGGMTEIIEPSADVPKRSVNDLKGLVMGKIPYCSGIALCGTYPGGVGPDFYAKLAETALARNKIVLLDGFRGVDATLRTGVSVIKINKTELCVLANRGEISAAARNIFKKYKVGLIAVTAGPDRAYLFEKDRTFAYKLPDVGKIVNPIGAGDTVSAVLLSELVMGTSPSDAFRFALGAGTASCLRLKSADYSRDEAIRIAKKIACTSK